MFSTIKPYIELCRISNLPTVWTNVLAATVLSSEGLNWPDFLVLLLSMSFLYSGGICLNDIYDEPVDRIKRPLRPIPSGRVSLRNALSLTISLFLTALALFYVVPYPRAIFAAILLIALIIIYDKYHKAHPLSIVIMAACRFMVFVVVSIALTGESGFPVIAAGLIQSIYTLSISIVARHENKLKKPFPFPAVPAMISGISLIDGMIMAYFVSPAWIAAGIGGTILTMFGQRYIRGD
jgi:4-hydroxybenzoate polyprenyltransferase